MKRLKDVRPDFKRVPPDRSLDAAAIAALQQRIGDNALLRDRERWRPVLERILALANELHPATRYGLKAEALDAHEVLGGSLRPAEFGRKPHKKPPVSKSALRVSQPATIPNEIAL